MLMRPGFVNETIDAMEWITRSGIQLGVVPALAAVAPELRLWFTTRSGGTSSNPYESLNLGEKTGDRPGNIRENRNRLLSALNLSPERIVRCDQVHGSRVSYVDRGGVQSKTDGVITRERNLALVISTADCYPVIAYAPSEKVLGALHVGRSGAALGIIRVALEMMKSHYSIDTRGTVAVIGAGICKRCYTVYPETAALFPAAHVDRSGGACRLDLLSHCTDQLLECGLKRRNIFNASLCTSCNPELFYSHRRDHGVTGRHWTVAMIGPSS